MRKLLFTGCWLLLLFVPQVISAQFITVGVSPGLGIANYRRYTAAQRAELPDRFYPGIAIEGNYILQGFPFPVSGYNSFGIGLYSVGQDSFNLQDGLGTGGIRRMHIRDYQMRYGYELPAENEFFTAWLGWSMGLRTGRSKILEAWNNLGPVAPESITTNLKERSFTLGGLAGAMYEFEHFFVFARYEFLLSPASAIFGTYTLHQFHAGIFVPVYQF
ncbi:MAG: hypothetical protein MUC87_14610 [Bacteroidia bacterium]|jgi:hypothetical protein|nr:hypothetical protein [Bacteroidia bacterium]